MELQHIGTLIVDCSNVCTKNSFFVESTDELICLSDSLSVVLTAWKPETQSVNQYSAIFLQEGLQHAVCICVLLK